MRLTNFIQNTRAEDTENSRRTIFSFIYSIRQIFSFALSFPNAMIWNRLARSFLNDAHRIEERANHLAFDVRGVSSKLEHPWGNDIVLTVHTIHFQRSDSADRMIWVNFEIENERSNNCLDHNPRDIDNGPILNRRDEWTNDVPFLSIDRRFTQTISIGVFRRFVLEDMVERKRCYATSICIKIILGIVIRRRNQSVWCRTFSVRFVGQAEIAIWRWDSTSKEKRCRSSYPRCLNKLNLNNNDHRVDMDLLQIDIHRWIVLRDRVSTGEQKLPIGKKFSREMTCCCRFVWHWIRDWDE